MSIAKPPKYAAEALQRLEGAGHSAYLVGGCVRDLLLCRRPNDYDIATSALPGQVMELFPRSHPTGLKHGTVTIVSRSSAIEVTTYRTEGGYTDHRRPDKVSFVSDIREDLKRRDFTVNAMAMNGEGELFDPLGGRQDLEKRLLRCVGEAQARFQEDALRMLRALRFSATLGFEIQKDAMRAIGELSPLSAYLASERVLAELTKTLLSPRPQTAGQLLELGLLAALPVKAGSFDLSGLSALPKNKAQRFAGFCAVLVQNGAIEDAPAFLHAARLDGATAKPAAFGARCALERPPVTQLDWKRLIAQRGEENALCAAAAADVLYGGRRRRTVARLIGSGQCLGLSALALSGEDLEKLGYSGKAVGERLHLLLEHVLSHPEDNTRQRLLKLTETI